MDERRHVDELDRDARGDGRRLVRRRAEEGEQRPQPLAAGCERVGADLGGDGRRTARDGRREARLDLLQVRVEPGQSADVLERGHRVAVPVWRATMPPPRRR